MAPKILVRLVGALTCMAAVVTGFDAEAGWRNRRCCYDSCCYSSCYTPCYSSCASSCGCASTCYTYRDACGYCRTSCGWTVVGTPVIAAGDCCVASTTGTPAAATQAAAPAPAAPASTTPVRAVSATAR